MDYLQWSLGISREIKQRRILNTRLDVSEAPTFTEKRFSTGLALNGGRKIVKFLLLSLVLHRPTRYLSTFHPHRCAFDKIDNSWEFIQPGPPQERI